MIINYDVVATIARKREEVDMVKNMRACRILICTIAVLLSFGILLAVQHPVFADAQTSILSGLQ